MRATIYAGLQCLSGQGVLLCTDPSEAVAGPGSPSLPPSWVDGPHAAYNGMQTPEKRDGQET